MLLHTASASKVPNPAARLEQNLSPVPYNVLHGSEGLWVLPGQSTQQQKEKAVGTRRDLLRFESSRIRSHRQQHRITTSSRPSRPFSFHVRSTKSQVVRQSKRVQALLKLLLNLLLLTAPTKLTRLTRLPKLTAATFAHCSIVPTICR